LDCFIGKELATQSSLLDTLAVSWSKGNSGRQLKRPDYNGSNPAFSVFFRPFSIAAVRESTTKHIRNYA
jgi:hypothetical protein